MKLSTHARNVMLSVALGIIIFYFNKIIGLSLAIIFFLYLNIIHNKREHHDDMAIFYQEGGGN
jgi:hypothetical protein